MRKPHVLLAFPHNGMVSIGASRGYNDACYHSMHVEVTGVEHNSSFVPLGYNSTFQTAMKSRDYGQITHYAMIHADIEPVVPRGYGVPSWLDILYAEMLETGADVVSVVSPYKEPAYERTTTVIGNPDDPWLPKRHILLSDRSRLPETFGIEDCGDPATEFLQVNTGLMLVDISKPYWDIPREGGDGESFAFELMQRIIRVPRDVQDIAAEVQKRDRAIAEIKAKPHKGPADYDMIRRLQAIVPCDTERRVQSRSEDWEMSRHVWKNGGKCVATWKVPLKHHGMAEWYNQLYPSRDESEAQAQAQGAPESLAVVS